MLTQYVTTMLSIFYPLTLGRPSLSTNHCDADRPDGLPAAERYGANSRSVKETSCMCIDDEKGNKTALMKILD